MLSSPLAAHSLKTKHQFSSQKPRKTLKPWVLPDGDSLSHVTHAAFAHNSSDPARWVSSGLLILLRDTAESRPLYRNYQLLTRGPSCSSQGYIRWQLYMYSVKLRHRHSLSSREDNESALSIPALTRAGASDQATDACSWRIPITWSSCDPYRDWISNHLIRRLPGKLICNYNEPRHSWRDCDESGLFQNMRLCHTFAEKTEV